MKNLLNIDDREVERVNYGVKLFKTNAFEAPEAILKYLNYIYERSSIEEVSLLAVAKQQLNALKKRI
jgi:hypothetical protein